MHKVWIIFHDIFKEKMRVMEYEKLLIGSLLTLAMAWGISLGDTALEKNQIISHNNQEIQLANEVPFEF